MMSLVIWTKHAISNSIILIRIQSTMENGPRMSSEIFSVYPIASDSSMLSEVIALADRNSKYLGLFPRSCFAREAEKKRILVAEFHDKLAGYVLYRTTKDRAVIQQLCVHESFRRQGVARSLVDDLVKRTKHLYGIALHCAREFKEAQKAWQKLGFFAIDEKRGRGKNSRVLTRYWYDHRHDDLWAESRKQESDHKFVVVIDANVAFDLQDPKRELASQSAVLLDGWLQEVASLWVTDELFNEVDRCPDRSIRQARKNFLRTLSKLDDDRASTAQVLEHLLSHIGSSGRASDISDLKHLAIAISAGAHAFVTHDRKLLQHANFVSDRYGLGLKTPSSLIVEFDEIARSDEFYPALVSGTGLSRKLVTDGGTDLLLRKFINHASGEKRHSLLHEVERLQSLTERGLLLQVSDASGPVGLLGIDFSDSGVALIKILRVGAGRGRATLLHLLLSIAVSESVSRSVPLVTLLDYFGDQDVLAACESFGFVASGKSCSKLNVYGCFTKSEAYSLVGKCDNEHGHNAVNYVRSLCESSTISDILRLERLLWPYVAKNESVPCYIIPIQPRFSTALFDVKSAEMNLLGIDPSLLFSPENVYYKSSKTSNPKGPGRVAWYVSKDSSGAFSQVRGFSQLNARRIGPAKEVFSSFSRLGVYRWQDVLEIAGRNPQGEVMAVQFGLTELATARVSYDCLQAILSDATGNSPPLSTAVHVPPSVYEKVYLEATLGR